ncbi:MAG: BACON domain-containing protein, partial [Prevotella sp.]|nr:BACON domain-containing protein [Prevotella sp.]
MAKQGRWILKNVRHDKPGVTIPSASLGLQSKTINLGSVTSNKKPDITTEVFTDLGVHLNLNNITKNPAEGSTFVQGGLTYKVHWVLTEKPQPEPEPEPVITYRLRITDAPENCLPYNGVAQFDAILEKYIDGVHDESSDLLVTSESEWSFISGGDYATRNPAGSNKFIITGNNTTDSVQTVGIKVEYNGQSNVQPATTSVCFNPEEVPVERDIKISTNKIDAVCEDNDLYIVTVTATNVDWTVTVAQNAQSWLSVQDITSDSFKVKVLDYDGASRSGTITVKSTTEGTNITCTITVKQEDCEPEPGSIKVSRTKVDAECEDNGAFSVSVTANVEWDVVVSSNAQSWITISNKTTTSFKINVADSTEGERTGTVTVKSVVDGAAESKTITVTQPDCEPEPGSIKISRTAINADCEDNSAFSVSVTANVEWDVVVPASAEGWVSISNKTATGFKVNVTDNTGGERSCVITVKSVEEGAADSKTITVRQPDCVAPPVQETISIGTIAEIPCDTDETYEISVNASTGWTAETNETWIHITGTDEDSIFVTFDENEGGDRTGVISAYTTEGGTMAWDSVEVTQLECEPEQWTFEVDDDDIRFECFPSDAEEVQITASENVEWTATTSDARFNIYLAGEAPSTAVTGTGNATLYVKPMIANTNVRYEVEGHLTIVSNFGDEVEITLYEDATPILAYTGTRSFSFGENGGSTAITLITNFNVVVTIPEEAQSWLHYSIGELGTDATDGLEVSFTIDANNAANERYANVTISLDYDGDCDAPDDITIAFNQDGKYIPPIPGAKFEVTDIFADFPYYAELGGYSHEYSFMSEDFYDSCGLSNGDIGGVVYLMPVHSCAIQVYYDTNVDLSNLTYEIVHVSPQNPEQEWLEVLMDPSEYRGGIGWSDVDSRDEPYPGDFILIKTRDSFEGSSLYD